MSHLSIAFVLLITAIYINQALSNQDLENNRLWWKILLSIPLSLTLLQSVIGVRLSSTWSAHLCLTFNQKCLILNSHKLFAIPVLISVISILLISLVKFDLFKNNWKFLISAFLLLISQITLGVLSLKTNLNEPLIIISHQIVASLMVATLSTLIFKNSSENILINSTKNNAILSFN